MEKGIICRTCAEQTSNPRKSNRITNRYAVQSLFEQVPIAGEFHSAAQMIIVCCSLPVEENDGLPEFICKECMEKLRNAYEFRLLCERSFKLFFNSTALEGEQIKIEKEDYVDTVIDENGSCDILIKDELEDRNLKNEDSVTLVTENIICGYDEVSFDESIKKLKGSKKHKKKLKKKKKIESKNLELIIEDCEQFNVENAICDYNEDTSCNENDVECKNKQNKRRLKSDPYVCNICQKIFKRKSSFIYHQDIHLGIKSYFCEICQKSYRFKKDHLNMHKRGFNHKCDICSKCFNTKAKLNIHIITHSENRMRMSCDFEGCTKTFISMTGLERHRVYHIGIKDFICHLCSKSFMDKYQLEVHIRSHTNEKPYSCSICSKKFNTSSAKTTHEKWHNNVRNHHCQHCGKSFVCASGLKRHLLCHTKSQELECRFCGKKFIRLDHRKRHELAIHGVTADINVKKSEIMT